MQKIRAIVSSISRTSWKIKALSLFLPVFFLYLLSIAMAPLHKMRGFEKLVDTDSLFMENYKDMYDHPELRPLVKEKAYKEALLRLVEYDSIQLVINLSDSTVNLSIKGVVIHQTKLGSIHTDKIFHGMPLIEELKLVSQPLAVHSQYASIVKEPVVVRQAPKDTLEAALNAWQPDTLLQNPAFVILSLDEGIQVIFEQEENPSFRDKWKKFNFYNRLRIKRCMETASDFVSLKKQVYHPCITLSMPVDELRAIYRALPDQIFMVIKL